ncbi:hypothetical protein ACO0LB_18060 [Undibacterium sp. SXout7W]|uniref:hypothetical protein n=1 Tax=Undibacterium sp. SXout7W TaxID=3413049 RepID=UPI003BF239DE
MRRAFFTLVHEGYDVEVFRTLKGVCKAVATLELSLSDDEERPVCTAAMVRKALKKDYIVRLYCVDNKGDWLYRIETHQAYAD